MTTTTHYETDFYQWTQQQAALLRQGLLSAVDIEHLAEEIESMGRSDRRSLGSFLENILLHLLKWRYQPERRGSSWIESIGNGRSAIDRLLEDSPSLAPQLPVLVTAEYRRARKEAVRQTGLPLATFPEPCPFTVEQITDDYWPD
ncbi:MAG: DUF29 domain-containing protein [Candidatus Competibacteraceae bacterium]|nr:DUF29 domain-containing protein [Candidatus Competibacteraceae bacterium]MBK8755176.1 DUF29 domain-containing protein [Candidatus Competibacteraceae bacterium]